MNRFKNLLRPQIVPLPEVSFYASWNSDRRWNQLQIRQIFVLSQQANQKEAEGQI